MKFIYFGSSVFSKIILENIFYAGFRPCLVVTKPDAPQGRGLKVCPTEISKLADNHNIKTLKPENLFDSHFLKKVSGAKLELMVVADYGKIMPSALLSLPRILPLGIHPSLLPRYRGAAPIERSLMAGEKITGITIFKIIKKVDAGPVALQKTIKVKPKDNYFSLRMKLASLGAEAFLETINKIKENRLHLAPQGDTKTAAAPKLTKKEGQIIWEKPAEEINNLIKATLNWPTAYTYYQGKVIKITEAESLPEPEKEDKKASTIIKIEKDGIYVAAGKGALKITRLKPEGKKEMPGWDFACGHKMKKGESFNRNR